MRFDWDPEKNESIKRERGVSFEEIALLLGSGVLWRVSDHWNQEKYPGQRVFFVPVDGYIYLVPYVLDGDTIFLKTAIPSRKATREFRSEREDDHDETS
jgi:uncharacterized DUF497 family protein